MLGGRKYRLSTMAEKASVFIDGGYLSRILKNNFNEVRIDLGKLGEEVCSKIGCFRLRTYYYTCEPLVRENNQNDIQRQASFQQFISKLKRLSRFQVKLGRLQVINGIFKQKMVDVLMSLDISTMSYENQVQHIVIIAGDSDFIPAIQNAKSYGTIIHLFYHTSSVHHDLLDHVDERYEITAELINTIKT